MERYSPITSLVFIPVAVRSDGERRIGTHGKNETGASQTSFASPTSLSSASILLHHLVYLEIQLAVQLYTPLAAYPATAHSINSFARCSQLEPRASRWLQPPRLRVSQTQTATAATTKRRLELGRRTRGQRRQLDYKRSRTSEGQLKPSLASKLLSSRRRTNCRGRDDLSFTTWRKRTREATSSWL